MVHFSRAPLASRSVALAVALSIAATGSGLPMCLSLLAQAAAPCAMHSVSRGGAPHEHAPQFAALVAQTAGHACHQDAAGLSCTAGSTCPTGGPAAPVWAGTPVALDGACRIGVLGPVAAFASYLAPPLSPPPQA